MIFAAIVGGTASAIVSAAIHDGSGTIHACYRTSGGLLNSKGSLRVIDTGNGDTCSNQETSLSWSQGGGAPTVYDANGQMLGSLVDHKGSDITVYNKSVQRLVDISFFSNSNEAYYVVGGVKPN